jgi:hypothetical protein
MRRLWLTLLLSLALVAGGLASAGPAFACSEKPAAASHDCCPDEGSTGDDGSGQDMMDCPFAQVCRTATAIAPEAQLVRISTPVAIDASLAFASDAPISAPADGLFRPPRTL